MKDSKDTLEKEEDKNHEKYEKYDKDWKDWKDWDNYQWRHWRHKHRRGCRRGPGGGGSAVYGLGFIGAVIFFIGHATTFWGGVLGFFQALVWPAFLVYEALKVLIK
ncbi:MAG: hypothetical protein NTV39_04260 [Candidatus Saccharibacteria bacterium]|nr:hypothetical protein [Candidatus Saccharibacteria bacterium]